ncbi:hypothetical protein Pint_29657 [Pistacia integerrima]|uniref:Uncharacterized protein n=1 Tax=Pistacia integerrima TaxID=434235 RepID=A0ACC0X380_9ROSI|nr:hypothetical protein Pint_29657 [Pistacia integerrima]
MKFLVVAHKVMWEAVAFMAAPFVAATLVITPHGQRNRWTFEVLDSYCPFAAPLWGLCSSV